MNTALQIMKIVGKIILATVRVIVLVIVLALWALNLLPSGAGRSNCKIARGLRVWALAGVRKSLPKSIAKHIR